MNHTPRKSPLLRRTFLKGAGVLTVSFSLGGVARAAVTPKGPNLGYNGPPADQLDSWIAIDRNGIATLYTGICELGTGSTTGVLQIMADELDIVFENTRLVGPDTDRTVDQFVSSGSRAIYIHGIPIRRAAAEARHALVNMAAAQLKAPVERLKVDAGVVSVDGEPQRRVSYGQLIGGRRFNLKVSDKVKVKTPDQYKIVGTSVARVDIPPKVMGTFTFAQDVKVPGMLHGRVVRPPAHGAKVLKLDEQSVAKLPGLIKVVHKADFIGVVCEREEQAITAAAALQVTWSSWAELPEMKDLYATIRTMPEFPQGYDERAPGGILAKSGDLKEGFAKAVKTVSATYEAPYHMHGSIGPSCAVADVRPDGATLWSGTQSPYGTREAIAKFLGMENEKVRLIYVEASGCYGQNGADDATLDAAIMSQAVGRPVRVQWSRADENGWEAYKTARVTDIRAGIDAEGNIVAWDFQGYGFSGYSRPMYHEPDQGGEPGTLISAQLAGWTEPGLEEGYNGMSLEGAPIYKIPHKNVYLKYLGPVSHRDGPLRIRTGSMRGVGGPDNLFVNDTMVDELAVLAGVDPVEYRLSQLEDPRAIAVLKAVAERAQWKPRTEPKTRTGIARGRGVGMYGYGPRYGRCATVVDVEVDTVTGKIKVPRVFTVVEFGLIINPDCVKSQCEGSVIQGISRILEEVTFDRSRVTSLDWATYPLITFEDVPAEIDVLILPRPDLAPAGAGEAPTKNIWAAIANGVYDATGVRLRRLPFSPASVKEAFARVA